MQDTDIQLIQRAVQGDADAFADFFDQYFQQVYNFALWLSSDPDAAEDLTQDTFIKAHKNLYRLGPPWNVRSWLYRIARNLHIDKHRREPETQELSPEAPIASQSPDPEGAVLQGEMADVVRRAFQRLTPNYREALVLRDIEGFHYAEIAEIMGTSLDSIKILIHRARLSFKDHYGLRLLTEEPFPQCTVLNELLDMSHDGETLEAQERQVRAHIKDCAACQQRKRELAALSVLLGALPRSQSRHRLRRRAARHVAAPRRPNRTRTIITILAAALLMMLLGFLIVSPPGRGGGGDTSPTPSEESEVLAPAAGTEGRTVTPIQDLTGVPSDTPTATATVSVPGGAVTEAPTDLPTEVVTTLPPGVDGSDGSLCGDGICQSGESPNWCGDCAPGGNPGGTGVSQPTPIPICGNGILETGEQCEFDSHCIGNPVGNTCVAGCLCGPG